jgi:hypothetical protein
VVVVGRRQSEKVERSPFCGKFTVLMLLAKTHLTQAFKPNGRKSNRNPQSKCDGMNLPTIRILSFSKN